MLDTNKKQIVFVEPKPTVNAYRIARSLKLTGRYETALVCFSSTLSAIEVDKKFLEKAFDKILVLELNHKLKFKSLIDFFKNTLSRDGRKFFREIKKMRPYLFQITGPDLFSLMLMFFLKKSPKVYYANDIWGMDKRNFLFTKDYWIKGSVQKFCERLCFKMADGALTKKSPKEFELLDYSINVPKRSLFLNCLDEWMFSPKKKRNKEIHFTFGGDPAIREEKKIPFIKVIRAITSQKIYFHTYGPTLIKKENQVFIKESKENKYYCYHERIKPSDLTKEMSEYNYGVIFDFLDPLEANLNPSRVSLNLASRMISYIEAGLPIIVNKQNEYMAGIVNKYGIGIVIDDFQDLKDIRKIIEQKDYRRFQRNIKKVQGKFKLNKKIKEIELFYDKVVRMKK